MVWLWYASFGARADLLLRAVGLGAGSMGVAEPLLREGEDPTAVADAEVSLAAPGGVSTC